MVIFGESEQKSKGSLCNGFDIFLYIWNYFLKFKYIPPFKFFRFGSEPDHKKLVEFRKANGKVRDIPG